MIMCFKWLRVSKDKRGTMSSPMTMESIREKVEESSAMLGDTTHGGA